MKDAEYLAMDQLAELSTSLYQESLSRYQANKDPGMRYLAIYFAVPSVLIEAIKAVETLTTEDYMMMEFNDLEGEEAAYAEQLRSAPITRIAGTLPEALEASILSFEPRSKPTSTPSSPMKALAKSPFLPSIKRSRSTGASSRFAVITLKAIWLIFSRPQLVWQLPLPLDESALSLLDMMQAPVAEGPNPWQQWQALDAMIAAFMGRPVDATLAHLTALRDEAPELFEPFDAVAIKAALKEKLGPIPVRGLAGTLEGGEYPLRLSLAPKRLGLDVTFFSRLTHPSVEMRPFPSALDVFASLGVERALAHADAKEAAANYHQAYLDTLAELGQEGPLAPTDIYHQWLAVLLAMAQPLDLPEDSRIRFAQSAAWGDKSLLSALAGYTQLKHAAVLYSMQEMGVECDSGRPIMILVEQPILPKPRGYVEPNLAFYQGLAALADTMYEQLLEGEAPSVQRWWDEDKISNARDFAQRLAKISEDELAGRPLSDEDLDWIIGVGALIEEIFMGTFKDPSAFMVGGDNRQERGVAIVTDIYTNVARAEVIQIAIGRLLDLYVVVPSTLGERMTQGASFSFFEFKGAQGDRLTDEAWNQRIQDGELPPLPSWTESFVE